MSYRVFAGFLAVSFALAGGASAAEVKRKAEFDGDIAKVWAKIGGWCAQRTAA
jgi:hypothetical protein